MIIALPMCASVPPRFVGARRAHRHLEKNNKRHSLSVTVEFSYSNYENTFFCYFFLFECVLFVILLWSLCKIVFCWVKDLSERNVLRVSQFFLINKQNIFLFFYVLGCRYFLRNVCDSWMKHDTQITLLGILIFSYHLFIYLIIR